MTLRTYDEISQLLINWQQAAGNDEYFSLGEIVSFCDIFADELSKARRQIDALDYNYGKACDDLREIKEREERVFVECKHKTLAIEQQLKDLCDAANLIVKEREMYKGMVEYLHAQRKRLVELLDKSMTVYTGTSDYCREVTEELSKIVPV